MKKLTIGLAALVAFLVPTASSAATYLYVDMTGQVNSLPALSATQALEEVRETGDALHSGVKLEQGLLRPGMVFGAEYAYVDVDGAFRTVRAASAPAALILAKDIAPHSGIMFLRPILP